MRNEREDFSDCDVELGEMTEPLQMSSAPPQGPEPPPTPPSPPQNDGPGGRVRPKHK